MATPEQKREYNRRWYAEHREYYSEYHRRWIAAHPEARRANRQQVHQKKLAWVNSAKQERGCARCGYNEHPAALDFHRTGQKGMTVSNAVNQKWSDQRIQAEIDQCEVLCSNCHRIEHHTPSST